MSTIIKETTKENWQQQSHPARLEERLPDGSVRCHLSPRNCVIKEGGRGFCKVRGNRGGRLVTLNYGKGVHLTEETIETEAVFHFSPGERILSLGNIGCMLNCGYCHNWKTSQARYVTDADVHYYTPEQIVETALRHGIRILSWTYNDPVVWHEFILDTAWLAKQAGLINLYKSAFFISEEAVDELLPVIDIFSISIKSIDPDYYRKVTTGWVEPVLAATRKVYKAGKHVEVSTLMVTDISDDEQTARRISEWVKAELDVTVPLHFVRFHPDYKMSNSTRTPIPKLLSAREVAHDLGIQHVYLGNVNGVDGTDSRCVKCGNLLVTRYGLNARKIGLDEHGHCTQCGHDAHIKLPLPLLPLETVVPDEVSLEGVDLRRFEWHGDIVSLHVQALNTSPKEACIVHRRRFADGSTGPWVKVHLASGESYRFIMAKSREDEVGPEVGIPQSVESNLHEVFDRAHFPTQSIEEVGVSHSDITPILRYAGKQNMYDQLRKEGESA
ncbi:MAG: COG1180: Radical SAM, Pyruvate-formate lyase-activating enzyme like [uncultured Paraburkholderia sp.]|uniref:AmmeMemoRadiSam system radical SAM enzyme n=1 Tax=uncultured Paraburkholderia sp. TaxID=1822466 RepID=UPI002592CA0C|nr:AmmeMemoRadiSam system radical SAM enzyme [uncultured Paraburkholderia sp.]CAH2903955.1 MAG: COG1180: Radical SAM, Pyruvate-formate lyase-activating enzyme like [uncultured Paraburkholderia sp.]CAH2941169.1 MAG: COG1180: Radical SAM, Pyruvate-formate lyase-activating enzyme like [uncultured Paraburkholderia sp.]